MKRVSEELSLDINQDLFIVPGNHDCVSEMEFDDKDLILSACKGNPLRVSGEWKTHLYERFKDYEAFVKELIPNYPGEHPAKIHSRIWNKQIQLMHVNTALIADGITKDEQILDIDELVEMDFRSDMPIIILAHNNFEDLHKDIQDRLKRLIDTHEISAYLCGDEHKSGVCKIEYDEKNFKNIPIVVCHKSAPESDDKFSECGFVIGEWEEDRAQMTGWNWSAEKGFERDLKIDGRTIDMKIKRQKTFLMTVPSKVKTEKVSQSPKTEMHDYEVGDGDDYVRRFIQVYDRLLPMQIEEINRKFEGKIATLKKYSSDMTRKELRQYIDTIHDKGMLNEVLAEMEKLLGRMD